MNPSEYKQKKIMEIEPCSMTLSKEATFMLDAIVVAENIFSKGTWDHESVVERLIKDCYQDLNVCK